MFAKYEMFDQVNICPLGINFALMSLSITTNSNVGVLSIRIRVITDALG